MHSYVSNEMSPEGIRRRYAERSQLNSLKEFEQGAELCATCLILVPQRIPFKKQSCSAKLKPIKLVRRASHPFVVLLDAAADIAEGLRLEPLQRRREVGVNLQTVEHVAAFAVIVI